MVPARIRNPIGLFRRDLMDRLQRKLTRKPVPPRTLLQNIQMTPWAREYLGVGKVAAKAILHELRSLPISANPVRVHDFGCGSGRVLRFFPRDGWELSGCDVDREAIEWSRRALPFANLIVNDSAPPLPYAEASFDVVFSVSVFTHFSPDEQRSWARELARIVKPGGVLVISTMGPSVLADFPHFATPDNREQLETEGSLFFRKTGAFNASAAFHTPAALARQFGPQFFLQRWLERGLDGYQDLTVFIRQ